MAGILVHEWLAASGGSENGFEEVVGIFPDAARWGLWGDSRGRFRNVHETVLARTPMRRSKAAAVPFMPVVWRHLPSRQADWVLCSSHLFAHHARFGGPAREAQKFVYVHTPARYVWVPELDGRGQGAASRIISSYLKPIDRRRAQEAHSIAANSRFIADRIGATWERESTVIYPPVAIQGFMAEPRPLTPADQGVVQGLPAEFILGVSRFIPYKRLDLVIETGEAAGIPVVIAGSGPDEQLLRERAAHSSVPVVVLHRPADEVLGWLYRAALAVVFAPIEDFGIVPVEAMAAGTPVIANAIGGAAESVVDGVTGVHVKEWTRDEMSAAVERVTGIEASACRERAKLFGPETFAAAIAGWVGRS